MLNKKYKKGTLLKSQIGAPCEFVHVSHVGFDKDMGFDIKGDDPQLKSFLNRVSLFITRISLVFYNYFDQNAILHTLRYLLFIGLYFMLIILSFIH